ncbi:sigma-54 dependent transcriptional regulator [Pontibacter sp. G13]|uniref:sigma-54-dependent transcriptional regulator n=1 Tax=Pontibacter sp. G13 TaxID=3074898 RepID=UPI00288BA044|nr:sigma-54 dependent transcriptional regulator [Pontibacter sp. G13]WNJ17055.1 sigma-54 dependent transcriptional regulator [Pontibacter sp. G13]
MSTNKARILIIDDDADVLQATRIFLKQHGFATDTEERPHFVNQLLSNQSYDLILLDMNFSKGANSGKEGFYWLHQILKADPSAVIVLITAYGGVETAIRAIKEGATDFIEKPWKNEKLLATIHSALQLRDSRKQLQTLEAKQQQLAKELTGSASEMIGESEAMQRVFDQIAKVAATDANVLILGENGTGKELVARELHRLSHRNDQVFINVDMGAIPENLFESELFGHVKGAFTDARADRVGRFELADGGTLFLDEIGNLTLPLQAKLLSAIQQRMVTRIGSNKVLDVNIRLVCATNMNLSEMVAHHTFRQDLLYRINTVEIHLPSLRERRSDIPVLAQHFAKVYAQKYHKDNHGISASAMSRMEKYHWPGNIRELQHAIERAVIMTDSDVLQPEDFFFHRAEPETAGLNLETYNLAEVEKLVIRKAISKHAGNISHAAKELGITRTSLYRRIEKYGL